MEDRDRWIRKRAPSSRNGSLDKSGSFSGAEAAAATPLSGDETSSAGPPSGTPCNGLSSASPTEASAAGSMEERDEVEYSFEVETHTTHLLSKLLLLAFEILDNF
jgi:hypothetical protein